jgi:aspartyl-tRNA(Asn)/glutamyl-tRNA(Gln) amidotransferase subunit C
MSKIGTDEVKRLAALAKISLNDEEVAKMSVELGQIVDFVEQLKAIDTDSLAPTNQVTGLEDVWRPDEVNPAPQTQDQLLQNVPQKQDGFIKVNRVME